MSDRALAEDLIEVFRRHGVSDADMAEVNIQWKGVDICADWQCVCSPDEEAFEWHVDGYTGGRLECDRCGRVYQIMHTAVATPRESATGE